MDIQKLRRSSTERSSVVTRHPSAEYLAVAFFVCALTLLAHGKSLQGFWRWDDGAHLNFVTLFSPWQYFFLPEVARAFTSANVAPWNALFYDFNLSLFGVDPTFHYAHLLLLVAIGTVLFYAVLRHWLPASAALLGSVALLLGKPTYFIAAGLMHGHYATGFVMTMLAIIGWASYLEKGEKFSLAYSVLAYLVATTCKEVYVPLALLLPFLPVGKWSQRLRAIIPYAIVAAAYTTWRYWLLGRLVGGYSQGSFNFFEAARQLLRIPVLLVGSDVQGALLGLASVVIIAVAVKKRLLNWPLVVATLTLVLLPLVPLTAFPGINAPDRYLFVPWLAFSAMLAASFSNKIARRVTIGAALLTTSALIAVHAKERRDLKAELKYWDVMYRFAVSADKSRQAIFVEPDAKEGYRRLVLTSARNAIDALTPGASPEKLQIVDESARGFFRARAKEMQLFEYVGGEMRSLPPEKVAALTRAISKIQIPEEVPLEAKIALYNGKLHWKFGPEDGSYLVYFKSPPSPQTGYTLSREGEIDWSDKKPLRLSFCRKDISEDVQACSPMIDFDFSTKTEISWTGLAKIHFDN